MVWICWGLFQQCSYCCVHMCYCTLAFIGVFSVLDPWVGWSVVPCPGCSLRSGWCSLLFTVKIGNGFQSFVVDGLKMSLLARPGLVELSLTVPPSVTVTRVVLNGGVYLREIVTGLSRVFVRIEVYGDAVLFSKLVYPTLMDDTKRLDEEDN